MQLENMDMLLENGSSHSHAYSLCLLEGFQGLMNLIKGTDKATRTVSTFLSCPDPIVR